MLESSAELFANAGVFAAIKGKTSVQPPHRESVQRLDAALTALTALAQSYREDWSQFDGRILRDQVERWTEFLSKAMAGQDVLEQAENLRQAWTEFGG